MPTKQLEPLIAIFPLSHLDSWRSKFTLGNNILTDLRNIDWVTIDGAANMAKGRQTLATGLAAAIIGLGRFSSASGTTPYSVAVLNEATVSWKTITDAGTVAAVTLPITWASARTRFASFAKKNIIIGANGATRPLKLLKGSLAAATRVGIDTPGTAPSVADGGAGNLNGSYQWRVTFESATHESSPGPVSTKLTLTNRQASLTSVPTSTDTQVTKRNIYRIGGVIPEWLYVGTINDNTTTTFTDNVADLNLGDALGFDRDPPRVTINWPIEHKQRIFAFDTNELLFSNYQEPEGWNADNALPVGGSGSILALGTTGSVLVILKDTETYALYGESLADFVLVPLFKKGIMAQNSCVSAEGVVFWLADDGVRMTDGREISFIGNEVRGLINSLSLAVRRTAVGGYAAGHYLLSFPGQFTLEYDLTTRKWGVYPWTFEYIISAHDENGLDQFVFTDGASSTSLRKWPGAYDDLGSAIAWYIERDSAAPKTENFQGFKTIYRAREAEIVAPPQSGITVTLLIVADGDTANKQYSTSVSLTSAPVRIGLPTNLTGKTFKVKVSGSHSAAVQIHGIIVWGFPEHPY